MTHAIRRAVGAASVVLVLFATGCGGNDADAENKYVQQVNSAQTEFSREYARVAGKFTVASSASQDRATVEQLKRTVDDSAKRLSEVKAPSQVTKLHAELVDLLNTYSERLGAAAAALSSETPSKIARATSKLAEDTARAGDSFGRTVADINAELSR